MKKGTILLLFGLLLSSHFVFSQAHKDTIETNIVIPHLHGTFSIEDSWEIHREAYLKQLEARKLSKKEIEKKLKEYDKQREKFVEQLEKHREQVEEHRRLMEEHRKKVDAHRKEIEKHRDRVEKQRELVEKHRDIFEKHRKLIEAQREQVRKHREIARNKQEFVHNLCNKEVELSGKKSFSKTIDISIENSEAIHFVITSKIKSGEVLVEIFDPKGKKEGELSLEHQKLGVISKAMNTFSTTSGSLNKTANSPKSGNWKVKISSKKANGYVRVMVAEAAKTTMDK
ncbi:hypothetical protein EMN47_17125 [Prolixibacteraceae bacterium JC049]|nr:hypothetical protein [Prolixibacteraceae bacterium JC049]